MGHSRQPLSLLTALLLLAACRGPFSRNRSMPAMRTLADAPELFMKGLRIQQYREEGLAWQLDAQFGEGYTTKNWMRVKDMQVALYDKGNPSTHITADRGVMTTGNDMLPGENNPSGKDLYAGDMYVSGNVVVISTDGSKVTTDWAHYHKKTELITSTAPVRVEREDSVTNGTGLEATSDLVNVKIYNQTLVVKEKPPAARSEKKPRKHRA